MADRTWPTRKKNVSCSFKGIEGNDRILTQKSFALEYVNIYQFNIYRKNRRVSSTVPRMVNYPAAILVYSIVRELKLHTVKLILRLPEGEKLKLL